MKTKNLLKYIIIGIVCAGLFLLAFASLKRCSIRRRHWRTASRAFLIIS